MAKHRTQKEKEELIQLFKNSGLSRVDFCSARNISTTSLRSWMREETKSPITFMQVIEPKHKETFSAIPDSSIQLEFKEVKLTFPLGTTPNFLGEIMKVIANV